MRLGVAIAVGLIAAGVAAAAPSDPVSSPPLDAPPATTVLRHGGLAVRWPVATHAQVAPGRWLVIRVRQQSAAPDPAHVAFVRLGPRGARRTVAAARLREGRFTVRIPNAVGARYRLRVAIGGWTHATLVRVVADCTQLSPPGRSAATLTLDRVAAATGETVTATLANTGEVCLSTGLGFEWQQRTAEGAWEPVTTVPSLPVPEIAVLVAPGETHAEEWPVQQELTPGTYRLVKQVTAQTRRAPTRTIASGALDVLAP
jgi:hypothetical protein